MSDSVAQWFGKYELLDRIAAGGMAEIYRARLTGAAGITKELVIKKILPHYAGNPAFIKMFIDEAQIVVGLNHGNIAQVFDFGEIEGEYYLAMEYVNGQPLSRVLRRMREMGIPTVPTPFALFIAIELCKALHYAHTKLDDRGRPLGIVHRDVSPQNVLLSYEGQVKIVDFGIAKARTADRAETAAGAVKGKYVYFSPEQAKTRDIDARSDVFALGVVLYEMLCGRLPFEGKMIDVLGRLVKGEFDRPRLVNPDITQALERIMLTALATDRKERYPSAQAMGEALAGHLYANSPTFSSDQLALLLQYLYEKELVADGRPVALPPTFLDQLPLWRRELKSNVPPPLPSDKPSSGKHSKPSPAARSGPNAQSRASGPGKLSDTGTAFDDESTDTQTGNRDPNFEDSEATKLDETTGPAPAPKPRPTGTETKSWLHVPKPPRRTLLFAAPIAAALFASLVVLGLLSRRGDFRVRVVSDPEGAVVRVDGTLLEERTPLVIRDLEASKSHRIEVLLPDHAPFERAVEGGKGDLVIVEAQLSKLSANERGGGPEPTDLSAQKNAFELPGSKAARIELDPRKAYKLWMDGEIRVMRTLETLPTLNFFLEGDLPASERFGQLGRQPVVVSGARALYAFVLTDEDSPHGGSATVSVEATDGSMAKGLLVKGFEHAIDLRAANGFRMGGLDPQATYELQLSAGRVPAALRRGPHGRATRALLLRDSALKAGRDNPEQRVVEVGKTYELTGARWISLGLPDDDRSDNSGALRISLKKRPAEKLAR